MINANKQSLISIRNQLMAYLVFVSAINIGGFKGAVELGEGIVEQLSALVEETE
jgi:hypothetical protein